MLSTILENKVKEKLVSGPAIRKNISLFEMVSNFRNCSDVRNGSKCHNGVEI